MAYVWEIRANGDADNGGGFDDTAAGTDYSQQDAAQASPTDLVIDGADNTKFTSSALGDDDELVGNVLNVTGGTGFTVQRVFITGNAAGTYTASAALGTVGSTGGTGKIGGAVVITDAVLESIVGLGGHAYIAADGTHTQTGDVNLSASGSQTDRFVFEGYNAARGDAPTGTDRPLIAGGSYFFAAEDWTDIRYIRHTSTTTSSLSFQGDAGAAVVGCSILNTTGSSDKIALHMSDNSGRSLVIGCYAENTNGEAMRMDGAGTIAASHFADSKVGVRPNANSITLSGCIVTGCATGVLAGGTASRVIIQNCTIDTCTTGIDPSGETDWIAVSSIVSNCTTGMTDTAHNGHWLDWNNWYGNTADVANVEKGPNATAVDPEYASATDYSVGASSLQGAAYPADINGTTYSRDVGAGQTAGGAAQRGAFVMLP